MAKHRKYTSKKKQIRIGIDRLYSILGRIKHDFQQAHGDEYHYGAMSGDVARIEEEALGLSRMAKDFLRNTPLGH